MIPDINETVMIRPLETGLFASVSYPILRRRRNNARPLTGGQKRPSGETGKYRDRTKCGFYRLKKFLNRAWR